MFGEISQIGGAAIIVSAAAAALLISYILARLGASKDYLPDHPNRRSSHRRVTPRSGGLAIITGWATAMLIVAILLSDAGDAQEMLKVTALGIGVVAIGFIDDRFSLSPLFKLSGQFACAAVFVWIVSELKIVPAPFFGEVGLGSAAVFLTIFWIVGFMNAFNFMDGAHGIAASSAIIVLCALGVATASSGAAVVAVIAMLLVFALGGFLKVNFPKGRIFMGDNGSQSVSFLIATLAVMAANQSDGVVSALFVPTAMMAFLFDVAFTLVHRIARKQPVLSAHREHLYQLLLSQGFPHTRVTGFYVALTAFSTMVAIMMLRFPPEKQWIAPASLVVGFILPALSLYRHCASDGYFSETPLEETSADDEILEGIRSVQQAAE